MTLLDEAPVKVKKVESVAPAQPDVTLSAKEQDAIINVAAAEEKPATVPGESEGERRAWGQPSATRRLERD